MPDLDGIAKPQLALTIGGLELAILQRVNKLLVSFHDFKTRPAQNDSSALQPDRFLAELKDLIHGMSNQQN